MENNNPAELKLLACPFCNKQPSLLYNPSQVWCAECCYNIEDECEEATIKRWNTRTRHPAVKPSDIKEILKNMIHGMPRGLTDEVAKAIVNFIEGGKS